MFSFSRFRFVGRSLVRFTLSLGRSSAIEDFGVGVGEAGTITGFGVAGLGGM